MFLNNILQITNQLHLLFKRITNQTTVITDTGIPQGNKNIRKVIKTQTAGSLYTKYEGTIQKGFR